jgi:hypothetical protein
MRPVHYYASGGESLYFDCYLQERGGTSSSAKYAHSFPRRHTDLRKVTCPECWRQIGAMATRRVGTVDAVARQHLPTRDTR